MANVEKMGFEKNKRIVKVMNNQRVTEFINDRLCRFRSKLEYNWALYLTLLMEQGEIFDWLYEPDKFYFREETQGPWQYIPDFKVFTSENEFYYQECKGYHDGQTNSKLRRFKKYNPDIEIELVLQNIPKRKKSKGANRRRVALKYARRIINASDIFRQCKGMLEFK